MHFKSNDQLCIFRIRNMTIIMQPPLKRFAYSPLPEFSLRGEVPQKSFFQNLSAEKTFVPKFFQFSIFTGYKFISGIWRSTSIHAKLRTTHSFTTGREKDIQNFSFRIANQSHQPAHMVRNKRIHWIHNNRANTSHFPGIRIIFCLCCQFCHQRLHKTLCKGCTNFFREKMRFLRAAGLEKTIVIFGEE